MGPSAAGSSTSRTRRSRGSPRSDKGSARSGSPGKGLGRQGLRELAARFGVRPNKALGQTFLADPNLARKIVGLARATRDENVLEIGAGLGSLTLPLAESGATVTAVEFDRGLVPALRDVTYGSGVRIIETDAMRADWSSILGRRRPWKMVSNLPYNIAVPLLAGMLEAQLPIDSYLVMVQREVGERITAEPGSPSYGAVSVKVEYLARSRAVRRVPREVFWPMPRVESVLVELVPRRSPPVPGSRDLIFSLVDEGFRERRKTMRNALRRLGMELPGASAALEAAGLSSDCRAEDLALPDFARLAGVAGVG